MPIPKDRIIDAPEPVPPHLHVVTYEVTVIQSLVPAFYDLIPEAERTPMNMVRSDVQDYIKGAMTLEELLGSYDKTSVIVKAALPVPARMNGGPNA